ncbi:unnamed protein product, partial [Polarella glacialis]
AARALGQLGAAGCTHAAALTICLTDEIYHVSEAALWALGQFGAAGALHVVPCLTSERWEARKAAVIVLGQLPPDGAQPHAFHFALRLGDAVLDVRKAAAEALLRLPMESLPPRAVALAALGPHDREELRHFAQQALGKLEARKKAEALAAILRDLSSVH